MKKFTKFTTLAIAAVLLISSMVFPSSVRADIIRSVSPALHFEMTLANTLRTLEAEMNSVKSNELIARIIEIFEGDFSTTLELNLDAAQDQNSPWYWPMPRVELGMTHNRWDRVLSFEVGVQMDEFEESEFSTFPGIDLNLGAYFTSNRFIARINDDSVFINALDPFADLMAFSELNQDTTMAWVAGAIQRFLDNDVSYDNIIALIESYMNSSLSDETMNQLEILSRNLIRGSNINAVNRPFEFNGQTANRDVTAIVISAEDLNVFAVEALTLILNDEAIRAYFRNMDAFGAIPFWFGWGAFRGADQMLDQMIEELENVPDLFEADLRLDFIETNGVYNGLVVTMNGFDDRFEFGVLGSDNMLDHVYMLIDSPISTTRISLIGNNVRTNHFRSQLIVESQSRFTWAEADNTTIINFDWDTASGSDNISIRIESDNNRRSYMSGSEWRIDSNLAEIASLEEYIAMMEEFMAEENAYWLQEEIDWASERLEWLREDTHRASETGWNEWNSWRDEISINGTFALTPTRNIVAYLARVNSVSHWDGRQHGEVFNFADDDFRWTLNRVSGRVDVPTMPRAFRNMTINELEEIAMRHMGDIF